MIFFLFCSNYGLTGDCKSGTESTEVHVDVVDQDNGESGSQAREEGLGVVLKTKRFPFNLNVLHSGGSVLVLQNSWDGTRWGGCWQVGFDSRKPVL